VAEADDGARQALAHRPRDLLGHWRATGDDELDRRQVACVDRRVPGQGGHDRWQHLVADRGWPAADYVERTIASIMAEVVVPAERR
jgi:hypothetical protein